MAVSAATVGRLQRMMAAQEVDHPALTSPDERTEYFPNRRKVFRSLHNSFPANLRYWSRGWTTEVVHGRPRAEMRSTPGLQATGVDETSWWCERKGEAEMADDDRK